jgi:stage II sporulation protein M
MKKVKRKVKEKKRGKKSINTFLKENYSKSWDYIKESKKFIFAVIIIFFISAIIGFLFQPQEIINFILDYIKEILEKTTGMSSSEMIRFIFLNNLEVSFMGLLWGFILGIFPILSIFANGYVVGYVSSLAISSSGASALLNLLPHGIFELPAIFIAFGMGIKLGTFIFHKEKIKTLSRFLIDSLRVFIFVVLPLLIIAAIIEGSFISLLS